MRYKLTLEETKIFREINLAITVNQRTINALANDRQALLRATLNRLGIQEVDGTVTPVELDLEKEEISVGVVKPLGGLIVPQGTKLKNGGAN